MLRINRGRECSRRLEVLKTDPANVTLPLAAPTSPPIYRSAMSPLSVWTSIRVPPPLIFW